MSEIKFNRIWQMPNKNTFDIKAIREIIEKYIKELPENAVIVDPFANKNKIANITNDLDPQYDTTYHMDATDFLKSLPDNSIDMLLYDPPYCYDKDTMVLTKTGWKKITGITEDDEIATRNVNGNTEYHKPIDIIQKDYTGKMINIKNGNIDLLITPNHNCLVKNSNEHCLVEAQSLSNINEPIYFTSYMKWNKLPELNTVIPHIYNKNNNVEYLEKEWYTVEMMRFLGIFLRYGETKVTYTKFKNTRKIKINYKTIISYKNIGDREEKLINRTLARAQGTFYDHTFKKTANGYIIDGKQLYIFLSHFKNKEDRIVPQFFKEYSRQDFRKMFDFLFVYKNDFTTKSKQFAYDLQEIIMKAGMSAIILNENKEYIIRLINEKDGLIINKEDIKEVDFDGKIYCVTVPNSVIMVQRNGKSCWCGNSPRQVSECYKSLGKTVNMQTTQASYWSKQKEEIGRIVKDGGYVITCSWNSGGIGKKYGFEIIEILLVPHGGWHNDTIVVIERKENKK